jgi:predicted deacylase
VECCTAAPSAEVARRVAEAHRVAALAAPRFGHAALWTALAPTVREAATVRIREIGRSVEGRPLRALTVGTGATTVLLWSQMHGDEPTATMALTDLLAWLAAPAVEGALRDFLLSQLTLVVVPMLNPDGAQRFVRENAAGVDVNRDARRLATPEARALEALHTELRPAFAFNLHDQSTRRLDTPGRPAVAMALLAPAADARRGYGAARATARLVAATMAAVLEREIPGRVARYDDTFEPDAFGELLQGRGTSTVTVESGELPGDAGRQRLRALNLVALLTALDAIAGERWRAADAAVYDALPPNGTLPGVGTRAQRRER